MRSLAQKRPLAFVLLVMVLLELIILGGLLVARLAGVPLLSLDLPILLLNAVVAGVLLSRLGWWREAGFNAPPAWRKLHLLLFPVLLLLVPTLLLQPQFPTGGRFVVLLIVTLLIGFQEEAIFRGVIMRALEPRGVYQAVLVSAGLFGLIHANSLLVGRDPLFVLSQIIASTLGAVGLGALRVRMNTVWPLVFLHAANDFLQFSAAGGLAAEAVASYLPYLKVGIATAMCLYGLYLLRGEAQGVRPQVVAADVAL